MSNEAIIEKIEKLSDKIRSNEANVADYEEYEDIVDDYYDHEAVRLPLQKAGVSSYGELITARGKAKTYEERKTIEVVALGALLALGLALIISGLFED